uniref:Uncharacterized protein n=1 Tax=Arion vulgaris TaxID=1028688 RepID=A0A0B7B614_9EUPU
MLGLHLSLNDFSKQKATQTKTGQLPNYEHFRASCPSVPQKRIQLTPQPHEYKIPDWQISHVYMWAAPQTAVYIL